MAKYHISEGEPKECSAEDGNCPIGGGSEDHFDDIKEARSAAEEINANEAGGTIGTATQKRADRHAGGQPRNVDSVDDEDSYVESVGETRTPNEHTFDDGASSFARLKDSQWGDTPIPDFPDGTSFAARYDEHFSELTAWEEENGKTFDGAEYSRLSSPAPVLGGEKPTALRERGSGFISKEEALEEPSLQYYAEKEMDDEDVIYTLHARQGGGNRECFCDDEDDKHEDNCIALDNESIAAAYPNYITDTDDSFDTTYATFYFSTSKDPEDWKTFRENEQTAREMSRLAEERRHIEEGNRTPWSVFAKDEEDYGTLDISGQREKKAVAAAESSRKKQKKTEDAHRRLDDVDADLTDDDVDTAYAYLEPRKRRLIDQAAEEKRTYRDALKKIDDAKRMRREAESLPDDSPLKRDLLEDRGPITLRSTGKTVELGSKMDSLENDAQRIVDSRNPEREASPVKKLSEELFKASQTEKIRAEDSEEAADKLREGRKKGWRAGWPDPSVPQPELPDVSTEN